MRNGFVCLLLAFSCLAADPKTENLYPGPAPGAMGGEERDIPTLTISLAEPAKATGTGIVVCPGGGYGALAIDHEGKQIAQYLNELGISAFVLKYRLGPRYQHPAPLQDAQRAIRTVRARAKEFAISAQRIGIWGFSAGGHLASTAGTQWDTGKPDSGDAIERMSSRPDFMVLAYAVISFTTQYTHKGSRRNLLGNTPDEALVSSLSSETRVTPQTPPTFLFHTNEDSGVPPENSVLFYLALRKAGVPAEMHIYERGRHGVGLAQSDPVLKSWPERLTDWFRIRGLLALP